MSKMKSAPTPAPVSLPGLETSGNHEALIVRLNAALLAKDERIEQLELAKHRLEDQLSAASGRALAAEAWLAESTGAEYIVPGRKVAKVPPWQIAAIPQSEAVRPSEMPAAPDPSRKNWKLPIASKFVRLVAPARGSHRDGWTERYFHAALLSEHRLRECTLEVWLKADSDEKIARIIAKIDSVQRHAALLKIGELNTMKFVIDVAAGTIFQLELICDYVKPAEPPDTRVLSYILWSMMFA